MRRFMASAWGPVLTALTLIAITLWLIGGMAALKLSAFVVAIAVLDIAFGELDRTFSEDVNRTWHASPFRFWLWGILAGAILLLGLIAHFTGV